VTTFHPRLATRPRKQSAVADGPPDLIVEDLDMPATAGSPGTCVRLYRPRSARGVVPALMRVHSGGMVLGDHLQDERANVSIARSLGITVVSVGYRLAPANPAPAALEVVPGAFHGFDAGRGP